MVFHRSGSPSSWAVVVGPPHQRDRNDCKYQTNAHHVGSQPPSKNALLRVMGGRSITLGSAGSTARAKAGKPSVTRFIQRICRGVRGTSRIGSSRGEAAMVSTSPMLEPRMYFTKRRMLVVNHPPFLRGGDDGGEVVVQQHHVAGFFADVGAGNAHSDADFRLLQGRGVVDPISRSWRQFGLFLQACTMRSLCSGETRA
jgi:hypothetical protein